MKQTTIPLSRTAIRSISKTRLLFSKHVFTLRMKAISPFTHASSSSCDRDPRRRPPTPPKRPPLSSQRQIQVVVKEYVVPAVAIVAAATLLAPVIDAVAFSAFGFAVAAASIAAAFSLFWLFLPIIMAFAGLPLLFGGGLFAAMAAGAAGTLLFSTFLRVGLILGALWLGVSVARTLLGSSPSPDSSSSGSSDTVIDVDASTVECDDMEEERRQREQELRAFDDLLRRRERLKKGGG